MVGSAAGGDHHHQHDNHCEPLEDYGPLVKRPETRRCCIERLKDNCVWKEETRCIDVTDLQCEVCLWIFTRGGMSVTHRLTGLILITI